MSSSYLKNGKDTYFGLYTSPTPSLDDGYYDTADSYAIASFVDANLNNKLDVGEKFYAYYIDLNWTYTGYYSGLTIGPNNDPAFYYYTRWDLGDETYYQTYEYHAVNTTGESFQSYTFQSAPSITLCLLPSTLIKLANNQFKQAGHLAPGDWVATPAGPQAIKFVGKTIRNLLDLRATGRMPIRIDAGALGDLGPEATIHCTPSHAFHIKGCLVEAQALINGSSIVQLDQWDSPFITYISIELEHHQLVWANGLLTETYYATVHDNNYTSESWDNYNHYLALYGESQPMKELELPRIAFERQLPPEIRSVVSLLNGSSPLAKYKLLVPA